MAMYATISHKKGERHEFVFIFKSKQAAIRGAKMDVSRIGDEDSEVYMIKGLDDLGYLRSDFDIDMIRRYGERIARFEKESEQ